MITIAQSQYRQHRDIINANKFEAQDSKRTGGKKPVMKIVICALDLTTFTSNGVVTDCFDLEMMKLKNNLKNVNSLVANHYRKQNLKILEVSNLLQNMMIF